MDRMLVVVFDNESKAYEGKKALLQLDGEGSIGVYGYVVLAKNADGSSSVKQGDDVGPIWLAGRDIVGESHWCVGGASRLSCWRQRWSFGWRGLRRKQCRHRVRFHR